MNRSENRSSPESQGASVGRNSNRIKNATFNLFGAEYKLNVNDKEVSNLHGGPTGFSYRVFDVLPYNDTDNSVEFSYFSNIHTLSRILSIDLSLPQEIFSQCL